MFQDDYLSIFFFFGQVRKKLLKDYFMQKNIKQAKITKNKSKNYVQENIGYLSNFSMWHIILDFIESRCS